MADQTVKLDTKAMELLQSIDARLKSLQDACCDVGDERLRARALRVQVQNFDEAAG